MHTDLTPARVAAFEREDELQPPPVRRTDRQTDRGALPLTLPSPLRERLSARARPRVELAGEDSAAAWDAFVSAQPDSTAYQLFAWKRVAERAYGMQAPFLLARDGRSAAVRGVLPLFVVARPFGRYVTSGLFGAYGPLLATDPEAARALLECAKGVTDAYRAGLLHLKLLGTEQLGVPFQRQNIWVTARLPLARDSRAVWDSLSGHNRNKIRRAQKNQLRAQVGHDNLEAFYDVLAENMHRKGSPIYGLSFMRELVEQMGERAEVVTLTRGGETVSAALTLSFNGVCYVPFASSRPGSFALRPNYLLYWEIIERACARGLSVLDFGTSMLGQSTLEFKQQWHPTLEQVSSFLYARSEAPPVIVPTGPKVQWLMRAWRALPRPVADALGPRVMKWTP